ncbi:MAG: GYF domain-containing protein [Muribaculaceae bacterium]
MQAEYYFVVNGQQQGPFPKEELRKYNISPDTLVWRAGMTNWVKATELPELADLFAINVEVVDNPSNFQTGENVSQDTSDNNWFAMFAGNRFGPTSISALIANGLTRDTPVWHPGMNDWQPAYTQTEVMTALNQVPPTGNSYGQHPPYSQPNGFANNPQYGQQNPYGYGSQTPNGYPQYGQSADNKPNFAANPQYNSGQTYGQNYGQQNYGQQNYGQNYGQQNPNQFGNSSAYTNWLPLAIVATILGFLCSCIGAIFGIIGIIQANKANGFYAIGNESMGNQANNTAKTMTIIGFVLAGIGLISSIFWFNSSNRLFDLITYSI